MSSTDELLGNNDTYAASFDKGDLALPPAKKVAVVAWTRGSTWAGRSGSRRATRT